MGWSKEASKTRPSTTSGRYCPYKGLLLCGTCNFNVTAYTKDKVLSKGNTAEYIFYTCTKKSKQVKCKEPQLSSKLLEQQVVSKMIEYEITQAEAEECKKWTQQLFNDYIKKKSRYKPLWQSDLQKAEKALDVLDDKLEAGIITDERYQARAKKHEDTIARTTKLLEGTDTNAKAWLELANETLSGATNIGDVFQIASDEERRRLMTFVGSNWYLTDKKVALTPRKPLHLLHSSNRNLDWRA